MNSGSAAGRNRITADRATPYLCGKFVRTYFRLLRCAAAFAESCFTRSFTIRSINL
jgi:hypothetical protein